MKVECLECGCKFSTRSMLPECPKCGGSDIELRLPSSDLLRRKPLLMSWNEARKTGS